MVKYYGRNDHKDNLIDKEYVDKGFFGKSKGIVHISPTPPSDTTLLWLDNSENDSLTVDIKDVLNDTGWRDITEFVSLPSNVNYSNLASKVVLRRKDDRVEMAFSNFSWDRNGYVQNWVDSKIANYIRPPSLKFENESTLFLPFTQKVFSSNGDYIILDWISGSNLRLINNNAGKVFNGYVTWTTLTGFPRIVYGKRHVIE